VFLLQARKLKTNLGLFLFRHVFPSAESPAPEGASGGGTGRRPRPACRLSTFRRLCECYYFIFDFRAVRWQNVMVPSRCVVSGGHHTV